ncbi:MULTISPECIES: RbsD/FucU family protein [Pacificibacter]|uniref:RbsD/FucU family protein n=1 Tax=Pacificibacter TaxID=1042323 RepID=UPI001C083519|nr:MULTISPECIES: RbsD/FucU domain-containing protein [Pacificibacter]MBU2936690.1 ribose ABC transporter [Pacificibacter marinus]MDO6614508.1 RbsD/FucU domain-containing protein [Pacificibacter sp. 1_MG-2023]
MLRNIPPILSPDILWSLRAMGHGDELVIVDANFPATALGARCHRLDGLTATDVLKAVLTVMPLDSYVPDPALVMEVVGDPDAVPPIVAEFQTITLETADNPVTLGKLERFAFYDRAKTAFAIIQTGETRLYGNIIVKKGVIDQ